MEVESCCRACGERGCTSTNHHTCSICSRRGHNKIGCPKNTQGSSSATNEGVGQLYQAVQKHIGLRRNSTRCISQGEKEMALRVIAGCDLEAHVPLSKECLIDKVTRLTGLSKGKVSKFKRSLEKDENPEIKEDQRGLWPRPQPRDILTKIRECIATLHSKGIMTTVPKIAINLNEWYRCKLSHPQLYRILHKIGFKYRQPKGQNVSFAHEDKGMQEYRLTYLRAITSARGTREVVYLDESYVNQRHMHDFCWMEADSNVYIPSGKGPRYIMYAAGSRNGWLGEPVIFPYKDSTSDYHNGMNSAHFEELFTQTCHAAQEELGPSVLLLDNAAYHKKLTSDKDRIGFWQKLPAAAVLEAWRAHEVPGQDQYKGPQVQYKKQVIDFLRKNPPTGVCKVTAIAAAYGHKVLFLPPYRPELNAIENAWGAVKNKVASRNSAGVTFPMLLNIIKKAFPEVTIDSWMGMDQKIQKEEQKQLKILGEEEARRQAFKDANPGLVIQLTAEDDDDDSSDDGLMDEISEGLDGDDDTAAASPFGGMLEEDRIAAETLISLQNLNDGGHTEE